MKTKKNLLFYVLSFISLILILLTDNIFHDDGTKLLDIIVITIIILNFILSFFTSGNKLLIYTAVLQFLYTILTVNYNDEMDSYFYRLNYIFSLAKIQNNSLSAMIQNVWFMSFLLLTIIEVMLLMRIVYKRIIKRD
ncbi:MAG: hypothetical protein MUW56_17465 [Chryseobacterium sp.]|uniref:hypothetical protein n=1 Tax=Chryseobacterium sp. TaxID=1871047 RepID=UPI0025BEC6AC|nr:hypothetical protein [Chryseobacterium sp.]MCJ7935360.1 hypothetical protein [Chryseobacterium sp.]